MKRFMAYFSVALLSISGLNAATTSGTFTFAQNAAPPAAPAAPAQAEVPLFTKDELKTLLSPIALYPDPLLAQMLPASAYPLEIVQLSRWLDKNKDAVAKQDFSGLDAQNWDPTVKAMGRFPTLVQKMNDDLDWTSDLGEAFIDQPDDVANMIQDLRAQAQKTGALKSSPQQKVSSVAENNRNVIVIEPAAPDQIYVPAYSNDVYSTGAGNAVAAGLLTFGTAVAVGAIVNNATWNWGSGAVYPPVWGAPGYRPGRPVINGDVNVGSGNTINNSNIIGNTKPWRPDPARTGNLKDKQPGQRPNHAQQLDRATTGQRPNAQRPSTQRPPQAQKPQRPAARPAPPTAFSGIERGQASAAFADRGAASRAQMNRPPGGSGRAGMHAGGGGPRGGAARGGGRRR